jgi:gliding motility-associated-like protein
MKKNLSIYLLSFLFTTSIFGQTVFQKNLDFVLDTAHIRCMPDGKNFFVVGKTLENSRLDVHFLKISNNGDVLWHKVHAIGSATYELKGVALQTDGILALVSSTTSAYLLKMDAQNGAMTFNKFIGTNEKVEMNEIATDDKDNIWLTGFHPSAFSGDSTYYFQMKADKNGVPRWMTNSVYRLIVANESFTRLQYYKSTNLTWHKESQLMASIADIGAKFTYGISYGFEGKRFHSMQVDTNFVIKERGRNYNISYLQSNAKYFLFGAPVIDQPNLGLYGLNKLYTFGLIHPDWTEVRVNETDDDVMVPVHSFGDDVVFYSPRFKTLTKYTEQLKPLWIRKYDFCSNTTGFSADIAQDGSIFTVRKIGTETVISRMNPDGLMPTCLSKDETGIVEYTYRATPNQYQYSTFHGERPLPIFKDTIRTANDKPAVLTPFCAKNNAIFNVPDTVCLNTKIKPTGVDTMRGLKHDWTFRPNFADTSIPEINLNKLGTQAVFHRIQFGQCQDSLTKFVYVESEPIIALNDTIICGQKNVAVNLTTKNGRNYFRDNRPINPVLTIDSSSIYTFKITSKACTTEKKVKIKINDFEIPKITQVGLPCSNEAYPIVFDKLFKNVTWDNQPIKTDTIFVTNGLLHTYSLTYKLDSNCVIKGTAQIKRTQCTDIFVPTTFSPNDDRVNDEFQAFPQSNFKITGLAIYDRWGELLFKSMDGSGTWDGKFKGQACTVGTYIYVVNYMNIKTLKTEIQSGDVNLMR